MNYFFETYGCQMNKSESNALERVLLDRGWTAAACPEAADLVVINTCSVRETAEERIRGRLGWYSGLKRLRESLVLQSENPCAVPKYRPSPVFLQHLALPPEKMPARPLRLVVTGCMAERLKNGLRQNFPVVDCVLGNFQKSHFDEIAAAAELQKSLPDAPCDEKYSFPALSHRAGEFSAFVQIIHGCNNFCSYCIVPFVRGREISRCPDAILRELDALSADGVKELTLLGQNVNSYSFDGVDFPHLLEKICRHLDETRSPIRWLRFMSSHPKDFSAELLDAIASQERLCRHVHLPVQSGSNRILAAMRRRYTREKYAEICAALRQKIPDVSISTDILVGFPGETDADFRETMSLMEEIGFEAAYTYFYNLREGTAAASMDDQLDENLKKSRLAEIVALQQKITHREMQKRLGTKAAVLVEGRSRNSPDAMLARTEQNDFAVIEGCDVAAGEFVNVAFDGLTGNTFRARMLA